MLSFYGNNTAWNVDKSGDYRTDCDRPRPHSGTRHRRPREIAIWAIDGAGRFPFDSQMGLML